MRKCPICKKDEKNIIKKMKFCIPKEYRISSEYNIVSCKHCGFCFADTNSTVADYDYYYKNFNYYVDSNQDNKSTCERNKPIIKAINKYLNKESEILNIGIGNGNFECELKNEGYKNIYGIDPDEESVECLRKKGLMAEKISIYDDVPSNLLNKFEAVFLLSTLEHLIDLDKVVNNIKQYVKKNGYIFISVPDIGSVQNDTTMIVNNFNQEHINYFSRISLINLFNNFGLKEIDFFTINHYEEKNNQCGIVSIFKNEQCSKKNIIKDIITESAIKTYLQFQENTKPKKIIKQFINSQEEIIIWGTGAYVMNLIINCELNKCNILNFVDNNVAKQNKLFLGKLIKAPKKEELVGRNIFICSMLHANEIKKQIDKMNIDCKVEII